MIRAIKHSILAAVAGLVLAACATTNVKDDPLKNTKKLVAEGHVSLYKNGAFRVPNTSISLIPPGPSALEFVQELSGMRARQSFETSIEKAAASVYVVSEGTKLTYKVSKNISSESGARADAIRRFTRENSTLLVYRSSDLGKDIYGKTWELSKDTFRAGGKIGGDIIQGSQALGTGVSEKGTEQGKALITGSMEAAKRIVESTNAGGDKISDEGTTQGVGLAKGSVQAAKDIVKSSGSGGDKISEEGTKQGMGLARGSLKTAGDISRSSTQRSAAAFQYAGNYFIEGYVAVPSKMKKRAGEMGDSLTDANFGGIFKTENDRRKELSQMTADIMSDTTRNYSANVSNSFKKAGKELDACSETGLNFAMLKSLRWALQAILWDATIQPVTKMTAGFVGYIGVNCLAFPSMVVVREGVATTKLAVEVTWDTAKMGYDLVAPTGVAAVAGVYGLLDYTAAHTVAGVTVVGGTVAGVSEAGLSKTAGAVVKGAGYPAAGATAVAGNVTGAGEVALSKAAGVAVKCAGYPAAGAAAVIGTVAGCSEIGVSQVSGIVIKGGGYAAGSSVEYIGMPLASAGIAVGGGTIGTAVGGFGIASGGVLFVGGEASALTTEGVGNVIAGTTLAGGTAVSTAGGAAYGVYELSKAVIVPTGYELGSGIVLSYDTLSHIAAHSILAVSDCAYVVLSLEGPRWVLYAIKGKTGTGEDLPVGTALDLKPMQEAGEEIYYLPVSDEEMNNVVNSVYDNLPEIQGGQEEVKTTEENEGE